MVIEHIETEPGNRILDTLKSEGWKVISQYSPLAFDKGIDYDSYTLRKDRQQLMFEWDNWFEWKISGPDEILTGLARRFGLEPRSSSEGNPP